MSGSENESPSVKRIALKEYAAGAFLANAPIWILSAVLPPKWSGESIIKVALTTYIITMAGGAWAGYLIARKTGQSYIKAGLPTGLFSYSLYALFMTLTGVKGGFIEDVPPIFGFFIGGAVGARFWERQNQQTRIRMKKDHAKE